MSSFQFPHPHISSRTAGKWHILSTGTVKSTMFALDSGIFTELGDAGRPPKNFGITVRPR
jgi:hypothetical protein